MMKACRTVSVDENAHSLGPKAKAASMASTPSALGSSRSYQEGAASPWTGSETPKDRQRAASHETALHNTVSDRATRRANRRAKRKAFFRKLFFLPPSPEEDERSAGDDVHEPSVPTPPPSSKAVLKKSLVKGDAPADEGSAYKLDDGYYASMASILSQYKTDYASEFGDEYESVTEKEDYTDMSDLDSNTDMSEISVFDLEEDQTDDEGDAIDEVDESFEDGHEYALGPIPETELIEGSSSHDAARELSAHVSPPVRVPMEYTLADRRGGSCVGGRHVLFTSAAFKRKQRQMLYNMRSIHENEQFIVPQVQDEDEDDSDGELNTSGVYALQSEWI